MKDLPKADEEEKSSSVASHIILGGALLVGIYLLSSASSSKTPVEAMDDATTPDEAASSLHSAVAAPLPSDSEPIDATDASREQADTELSLKSAMATLSTPRVDESLSPHDVAVLKKTKLVAPRSALDISCMGGIEASLAFVAASSKEQRRYDRDGSDSESSDKEDLSHGSSSSDMSGEELENFLNENPELAGAAALLPSLSRW